MKAGPRPKPNRPSGKMSSSTVRYIAMKKGKRTYRNYKQSKPAAGGPTESGDDDSRIRSVNKWSEADMQQAIDEFLKGGVGLRFVARAWRVPKSTLERRVKGKVAGHKHMLGKKTAFTEVEETELEEFLLDMARRGFPLTESDIRDLAFQYEKNNKKVFPDDKQRADYYWIKGFLCRHPRVSIKSPEGLSAARAVGMNKTVIFKWFDSYEELVNKLDIKESPSHVWNLDESGFQDHFVPKKAVGEKGQPLYQVTGGEKGETVTVLPVFNALGDFGPVMVIFKGIRMKSDWATGSPSNAIIRCSKDGYINKELFVEFGENFVKFLAKKDNSKKHVLIMDGHGSHIYNVDFLSLMKKHGVEVVCLPPHCTHWLQPADKALFRAMKANWEETGRKFVGETGGRRLMKTEFFTLFTPVWNKCTTVEICQNAFRATGIFPVNRLAIPDVAFAPSHTTERCLPESDGDHGGDRPNTAAVGTSSATNSGDGDNATSHAVDTACSSASDFGGGDGSDNVTSNAGNTTAIVSTAADGSDGGEKVPYGATTVGDGDNATSHAVDTAPSSAPDFGGGGSGGVSDNVTSYVGDTTAIVSSAADVTGSAKTVPSGATSIGDGGDGKVPSCVGVRVSFRDLKKIPTRERSTTRKRTKPPSSTLTSDEHFEFLSKSKKQPRTTKDKKKSVSAAVARDSKKKKLSKYKEKNAEDDTPCCVCGKKYNEPPADEWQQCTNCKLWFHDSCGPGETEFCYYCLG